MGEELAAVLDRKTSSSSAAQPVQKPRFSSLSVNAITREDAVRAVVGIGLVAACWEAAEVRLLQQLPG